MRRRRRSRLPSKPGSASRLTANAGSDRIVHAILTAPVAADGAAAQNRQSRLRNRVPSPLPFYVAKDVKSENLAASTARLFLGLRLECAQCHNHPFASWTRDQFWSYAAFFASLEKATADDGSLDPIRERPDRREVTIPGSEKVVRATFLDGSSPQFQPRDPARRTLADWMTAPENPYFARAAVNRIWAQLFGIGLVDPVDDMGADNPPSHPELLDTLARAFAEHGFDRKFLIRAITLSRPYQLTSHEAVPNADSDHRPGRPAPVRADAGARTDRRAALRQPGPGDRRDGRGSAARTFRGRDELVPRRVPREIRPSGREADRGADVDPASPRPDERPARGGCDAHRGGRDAVGRRRGPLPRHRGPGRDPLPCHLEPASAGPRKRPVWSRTWKAAARRETGERPSRTSSGHC